MGKEATLTKTDLDENKMLNAVLNDFAIKCRNEEIIFDVTISEILLDAMEKDVAVILINLLDNAVNASRNSKEKKIKLNIQNFQELKIFLHIHLNLH